VKFFQNCCCIARVIWIQEDVKSEPLLGMALRDSITKGALELITVKMHSIRIPTSFEMSGICLGTAILCKFTEANSLF
jgi:hypothetical protein